MRTLALCLSLAACTVEGGKDVPLVTGEGPIGVDPTTQQVKIDTAQVPVVPACATGQIVRRTANAWECVELRVPWGSVDGEPSFSLTGHMHTAADITDFPAALASAAAAAPLTVPSLNVVGPVQHGGAWMDRRTANLDVSDGSAIEVLRGGQYFDARLRMAWDGLSDVGFLVARVTAEDASTSLDIESLAHSGTLPFTQLRLVAALDGLTYLELAAISGAHLGQLTYTLFEGENANLLAPAPTSVSGGAVRITRTLAGLAAATGGVTVRGDGGLDVQRTIKSPMWKVTKAIDNYAGLPAPASAATVNLTTSGGTVVLFVSGSGYQAANQTIEVSVSVDSVSKGFLRTFTNEGSSHKALVPSPIIVSGLAAGNHNVRITASLGSFDTNDYFNVLAMELPF